MVYHVDSVTILITEIHMANQQRKYTGVLFLDLQLVGAFNNVIPEVLLILLDKYRIPHKIIAYVRATTCHRNLIGYAAGVALQQRYTSRGLPQGSIQSPILFNLYLALIETCLPLPVHILMYADDIAIYCSYKSLNNIRNHLNLALERIQLFLRNLGLTVSSTKSMYTIFLIKDLETYDCPCIAAASR